MNNDHRRKIVTRASVVLTVCLMSVGAAWLVAGEPRLPREDPETRRESRPELPAIAARDAQRESPVVDSETTGAFVVLRDKGSGGLVTFARFRGMDAGAPRALPVALGDGRWRAPQSGQFLVEAEGFASRSFRVETEGEVVVELEPTAGLELLFRWVEALGREPPRGIEVALYLPDSGGDPTLTPLRQGTSGASGEVAWRDLAPGTGYRLGYRAPRGLLVEVTPPNEARQVTPLAQGFQVRTTDDPFPGLSGPIELVAGRTLSLPVAVRSGGDVRGRILFEKEPHDRGRVRILDCRTIVDGQGKGARDRQVEALRTPGEDGSFSFEDLASGTKLLRATWRPTPNEISFASIPLELAEGESRDVGELVASRGSRAEFAVRIVGPEGAVLELADVFRPEPRPMATVMVSWVPAGKTRAEGFFEALEVPVGETFTVNGLGAGSIHLYADSHASPRAGVLVSGKPTIELPTPTSEVIELRFVARRTETFELELSMPPATPPFRGEAWFRCLTSGDIGGDIQQVDLRDLGGQGLVRHTLALVAGRYEILVHSNSLETPGDELENLVHVGELEIPSSDIVPVSLQTGATLEGRAFLEGGRPLAEQPVGLHLSGWKSASYWSMTDRDGRYRFSGLVPEREYHWQDGRSVRVGAAGSMTTLDVEDPGRFR